MKTTIRKLSTLLAVFLSLCITAQAHVYQAVSRHKASLQPVGEAVFSYEAAQIYHGVVMQGSARFVGANGAAIDPRRVALDHYDDASRRLYLTHDGVTNSLAVDADLLARIISWIDNGGTGLFTLCPDLTQVKAEALGLSRFSTEDWVATEFANSPIAEVCKYFDFPSEDLVKVLGDRTIASKHNRESLDTLPMDRLDRIVDGDYVVSDVDSDFVANLANNQVTLSGTVYRYYRAIDPASKTVYIYAVEAFRTSDYKHADPAEVRLHKQALDFARTTAVLRTIHDRNPGSWKAFESKFFSNPPSK